MGSSPSDAAMERHPDTPNAIAPSAAGAPHPDLPGRLAHLEEKLLEDADNARLLSDVADLQLQLARWTAARATLHRLLAQAPQHAAGRYRLAVAERALGDAATAQQLLTNLVSEGHAHPVVLQELARSEGQLGQWNGVVKALALFDVNTMVVAEADEIRLLRIRALHHLGYIESALAEAREWRQARGLKLPAQGLAAMASLHLDASELDAAAAVVAEASPAQLASNQELAAAARFVALARSREAPARVKPLTAVPNGHWVTEEELAMLHRQWADDARRQGREDALKEAREAVRAQRQAESRAQAERWHHLTSHLNQQLQTLRTQLQAQVADWTVIAATRLLGDRAPDDATAAVHQVLSEAGLHRPVTLLMHPRDLATVDAARSADPSRWPASVAFATGARVPPGGGVLQSAVGVPQTQAE